MSKQISSGELSLIVTQLLMNPAGIGELDELKTHANFTRDIAEVVAQYCGGEVSDVGVNDEFGLQNPKGQNVSSPLFVSIYPNDILPSLERNVWCSFDEFGWESEVADDYSITEGQPLTLADRRELTGLLTSNMLKTATEQAVLLGTERTTANEDTSEDDTDLLNTPELIPDEVQAILSKYEHAETYTEIDELIAELNSVGYTADYDLGANFFGLKKIKA